MPEPNNIELEKIFDKIREILKEKYFFGEIKIQFLQSEPTLCIIAEEIRPNMLD